MSNFIVGQITPDMLTHIKYGTFIFFGLLTFGGAAFLWVIVPETKRLTLEEMDVVFGSVGTAQKVGLPYHLSLIRSLFLRHRAFSFYLCRTEEVLEVFGPAKESRAAKAKIRMNCRTKPAFALSTKKSVSMTR